MFDLTLAMGKVKDRHVSVGMDLGIIKRLTIKNSRWSSWTDLSSANRSQSPLGLTEVKEATFRALNARDEVGGK